jgi:acyl carrier protein
MSARPTASDVIPVVASALGVERSALTEATRSGDLPAWDSLGHLRMCLALEERYGVIIDMETMATLTSIPRIVEFINRPAA